MKKLIVAVLVLASSCAVRKNLETPYTNPTDKPAVDDGSGGGGGDVPTGTKFCMPDANGNFDGATIVLQSGQTATDGSAWAEGGGCILRPIRDVWATLNNLEAMKFKAADSFTAVRTVHPKPEFTHLYEITYAKSTIIGPINWTIDWYHGFDKGTFEAPERVNVNYQRIRGTSNIPIWYGGIVLSKINSAVTSIGIRNNFKARQSSAANEASAKSALSEMVTNARTGAPDWNRLDNP